MTCRGENGPGPESLMALRPIGSKPLRSISSEILQMEETVAMLATMWAAARPGAQRCVFSHRQVSRAPGWSHARTRLTGS